MGSAAEKAAAAWGSHVVLSDRFFREATEALVPVDLLVLRALRSPFEIDIYVWLTWRFRRLRQRVTIPWASLALQFGCGYANPRQFKKRFLGYLRSVIDYYPEVRLEPERRRTVPSRAKNAERRWVMERHPRHRREIDRRGVHRQSSLFAPRPGRPPKSGLWP